jgi:hypothetical protein
MKHAPSTFALMAITVVAAILLGFAGGMEFANTEHEAAADAALAHQAKFISQASETDHAYRARLRELEAACGGKSAPRGW